MSGGNVLRLAEQKAPDRAEALRLIDEVRARVASGESTVAIIAEWDGSEHEPSFTLANAHPVARFDLMAITEFLHLWVREEIEYG